MQLGWITLTKQVSKASIVFAILTPRHAETVDFLKEYGIALVIVDEPNYPLVPEITADFVYIRVHRYNCFQT